MASDLLYQSQLSDLDAKQKLAQALLGTAFDRGNNYSVLSGIVDTLRAGQGEREMDDIRKQREQMIERRQQDMQAAMAQLLGVQQPSRQRQAPAQDGFAGQGDEPVMPSGAMGPPQLGPAMPGQLRQGPRQEGSSVDTPQAAPMDDPRLKQMQALMLAQQYPELAPLAQTMFKTEEPKDQVVGNALVRTRKNGPAEVLYTGEDKTPELIKYENALEKETDPRRRADIMAMIKKMSTHQPANVVNVDMKGQNEFAKTLGAGDAKRVLDADEASQMAVKSMTTLNRLDQLAKSGRLIQGAGADQRMAVANLANTFGIPVDPKKLKDSQQFDAYSKELVTNVVKSLGANPSNSDREFIEKTVPSLGKSPEASIALIGFLKNRAQQTIVDSQAMRQYGEKNNGLRGFVPPSLQSQQAQPTKPETPATYRYNPATGKME